MCSSSGVVPRVMSLSRTKPRRIMPEVSSNQNPMRTIIFLWQWPGLWWQWRCGWEHGTGVTGHIEGRWNLRGTRISTCPHPLLYVAEGSVWGIDWDGRWWYWTCQARQGLHPPQPQFEQVNKKFQGVKTDEEECRILSFGGFLSERDGHFRRAAEEN